MVIVIGGDVVDVVVVVVTAIFLAIVTRLSYEIYFPLGHPFIIRFVVTI